VALSLSHFSYTESILHLSASNIHLMTPQPKAVPCSQLVTASLLHRLGQGIPWGRSSKGEESLPVAVLLAIPREAARDRGL